MNLTPTQRRLLYLVGGLFLLLTLLVVLLISQTAPGGRRVPARAQLTGSNPALGLRFRYDSRVFKPAPYDGNAEFPLRLDHLRDPDEVPPYAEWSFYAKRIKGAGQLLRKAPGAMLFDFVGSQHVEVFSGLYKLQEVEEPFYEDTRIAGRFGLHQRLHYKFGPESFWPGYFPDQVAKGQEVFVDGWAVFTDKDLFFFYAVAAEPMTQSQRRSCQFVMDNLQFDALQPSATEAASEGTTNEQVPADGETAPDAAPAAEPDAGATPEPG